MVKIFISNSKYSKISVGVRRMGKYLLPAILAVLLFACQEELVPRDNAVYIIGPVDIPEKPEWGEIKVLDSPVFISPDKIAFLCLYNQLPDNDNCAIFVCTVNLDGSHFYCIPDSFQQASHIDYLGYQRLSATADGSRLLLTLICEGEGRLYILFIENGDVYDLQTPAGQVVNPDASISPNGESVAYTTIEGLWKMNKDGGNAQLLVPADYSLGQVTKYPSWAPDGSKLCFDMQGYNQEEDRVYDWICLVSADGGEVEKIVCGGMEPSFSSDGEYITYVSDGQFGQDRAIFKVSVEGGSPMQITYPPEYYSYGYGPLQGDAVPVYSPDGETIVFRSDVRTEPEPCEGASLWKINLE